MADQIKKLRPVLILLAVLILAAILGALWNASSISIADTGLWQLRMEYQAMYVQAVADAYAADSNIAMASQRLSFLCQEDGSLTAAVTKASELYGGNPREAANLARIQQLIDSDAVIQNADQNVCSKKAASVPSMLGFLAPFLLILGALGIVGYGVMTVINDNEAGAGKSKITLPSIPFLSGTKKEAGAAPAKEIKPATGESRAKINLPSFGKKTEAEPAQQVTAPVVTSSRVVPPTERAVATPPVSAPVSAPTVSANAPIAQFLTTYTHGLELYNESFVINSESKEYLGECGIDISDTLTSDGKYVSALEIWLFDKNDVRTVTKVIMSEHIFNDSSSRARLEPRGEAYEAEPNMKILLETATLKVQARIIDLAYGTGPMPANSYFDHIAIELNAWQRDESAGMTPSGSRVSPNTF